MIRYQEFDSLGFPLPEPKRAGRHMVRALYAYDGGDTKPKKVKTTPVTSQFAGTKRAEFGSDFGFGESFKDPTTGDLKTNTQLADFLQPIPEQAGRGISQNLDFLQLNPQQQYDQAVGGNNPLYNLLAEQTKRNTNSALGRSLVDNQGTGTSNSTTAGAAQAGILNDSILRSNQDLLQAINFGNETSRANLGSNLNTLGSLANLVYPLGSAANANLMQAFNQQDAVAQANAQAKLQADLQNTAALNAYNQQKSAGLGNIIGSGIGLLGSLALPGAGLLGSLIPKTGNNPFVPTAFGGSGSNLMSYTPPVSNFGFGTAIA